MTGNICIPSALERQAELDSSITYLENRTMVMGAIRVAFKELLSSLGYDKKRHVKCLDIACGNGFFGQVSPDYIDNLVGIDLSPDAIAKARQTSRGEYLIADITQLPFGVRTFDLVIGMNALDIDADILMTLSESKRVLKRGGWFIGGLDAGVALNIWKRAAYKEDTKIVPAYLGSMKGDQAVIKPTDYRPCKGNFYPNNLCMFSLTSVTPDVSHLVKKLHDSRITISEGIRTYQELLQQIGGHEIMDNTIFYFMDTMELLKRTGFRDVDWKNVSGEAVGCNNKGTLIRRNGKANIFLHDWSGYVETDAEEHARIGEPPLETDLSTLRDTQCVEFYRFPAVVARS